MSDYYVHRIPVVVGFDSSEERATVLRRFEEFLGEHELATDYELHDPDEDEPGLISVSCDVQLSFEAEECDDDHPKPEVVAKWEEELEGLLKTAFSVVSVELMDDAGILLDCCDR